MARTDPHFRLRFPDALREKVEAAAAENHRSMTAEIIARLEASFPQDAVDLSIADMVSAIHEHALRLAKAEEKVSDLENQVVDLRVRAGTLDYAGNDD